MDTPHIPHRSGSGTGSGAGGTSKSQTNKAFCKGDMAFPVDGAEVVGTVVNGGSMKKPASTGIASIGNTWGGLKMRRID